MHTSHTISLLLLYGWLAPLKPNCALHLQRSRDIVKINMGSEALNQLLGGGLESKCLTELFGEYRCWGSVSKPRLALTTNSQEAVKCSASPSTRISSRKLSVSALAPGLARHKSATRFASPLRCHRSKEEEPARFYTECSISAPQRQPRTPSPANAPITQAMPWTRCRAKPSSFCPKNQAGCLHECPHCRWHTSTPREPSDQIGSAPLPSASIWTRMRCWKT
jgi:Rad51